MYFVGLTSGVTYTVYVSSSNDITDQVPDEEFDTIAVSVQATTLGRLSSVSPPPINRSDDNNNYIMQDSKHTLVGCHIPYTQQKKD